MEPTQVATDFHVVDGSKVIRVKRFGQGAVSAHVLKTDRARGLAILKVANADVEPLPLGNSDKVEKGEEIRVFSDLSVPGGEFSEGIISNVRYDQGVRHFEFDAPVSPGSSGGPIVNARGEVIALTALKVAAITGTLKNAIPSNYLKKLLAGPGDPPETHPPQERTVTLQPEDSPNSNPLTPSVNTDPLQQGIEFYKRARFREAVESLQSVLSRLAKPKNQSQADLFALLHLYLGFSKWGLADTKSSVSAEFREALRYNPSVMLPDDVGQNHPIFKPLLERARQESTGTLIITASPSETEIEIYGGAVKPKLPDDRTEPLRLYKGNYAVEGRLNDASKVESVVIDPRNRETQRLHIEIPLPESQDFEITFDVFSAQKPKEVKVYYTSYDANGNQADRGMKVMQLREHKPETSKWVYHVKIPFATQGR